jgi:hypothetical protein
MVIDNFSQFDFNWLVSEKPISFFRVPSTQPMAVANDNAAQAAPNKNGTQLPA